SSGLPFNIVNPAETWVGGARSKNLTPSGASTYTWSLVGGSLPPGVSLSPGFSGAGTTALVGAPSVAGTYIYTLRAMDNANNANLADHVFTYRVAPIQVIAPPIEILHARDLPH